LLDALEKGVHELWLVFGPELATSRDDGLELLSIARRHAPSMPV
jgi:hypothetical protein